jgi:hypothetical protein
MAQGIRTQCVELRTLRENRAVPPGLAFLFSFPRGIPLPGFPMAPRRGWILEGLGPVLFESSSHNASRSFCVFVPGEERICVESASFQFAQQDVLIDRTVIDHGGGVRIVGHHLSD